VSQAEIQSQKNMLSLLIAFSLSFFHIRLIM